MQTAQRIRVGPVVEAQRAELLRLLSGDPYVGAPVEARVRAAGTLAALQTGGRCYGSTDAEGRLRAVALDSGALQLVGGDEADWRAVARYIAGRPRRSTSVVGRLPAVDALWRELHPHWGAPRDTRERQPLLVLDRAADLPAGDPRVRAVRAAELPAYLPASAAMFTEELGISPTRGVDGVRHYRARVTALINAGRAFAAFEQTPDGPSVLFKADIGAITPTTCQVQGVWMRPDLRGRGIARAAMASVLQAGLQLAPTVSLYVNDFNTPAIRLYRGLGMTEVAQLSTVLL